MLKKRVLIVDDEVATCTSLASFLDAAGYRALTALSGREAEALFEREPPDVVLLDLFLGVESGFDVLSRLKTRAPALPVILLTGRGSVELAVRAMKQGAEDFLLKPVALSDLLALLEQLLAGKRASKPEASALLKAPKSGARDPFIGTSEAIRNLREQAERIVSAESPVLLQGETGTGKGVLAHWLHQHGPRAGAPFIDLNCAGLSREFLETELFGHEKGAFTGASASKIGLLELANQGTVFLDEIGDMDPQIQPKLLKVLEEKHFRRLGDTRERSTDIRLIAATFQDFGSLVQAGRFRRDLYY